MMKRQNSTANCRCNWLLTYYDQKMEVHSRWYQHKEDAIVEMQKIDSAFPMKYAYITTLDDVYYPEKKETEK